MFIQLFGKTIHLLKSALDIQSQRHQAIVSNIANQDTPGYKAVEVDFDQSLRRALQPSDAVPMARTHAAHLSAGPGAPGAEPAVFRVRKAAGLDGNTVNAEQEMAKLSQNAMMYQATVEMLSKKLRILQTAIREGR